MDGLIGATGESDPADNKRPMDQLDPAVTETEPKVDYKKLVDLLDGSDVVTNADAFDFRPSSTMILRSSTPP